MKSIKIGLVSFFLLFTVNVFCQDLIIYTNTQSNHRSVVDFNKQLPSLLNKLKENQLAVEVIDLSSKVVKSPTAVLPAIYAFKNDQYYWYRGRYNEQNRIVSFARGAGRFQFGEGNQIFNDVFVISEKGFDQITRLKITEVKYQEEYNGDTSSHLKKFLERMLSTACLEKHSPNTQYKVYYLDIYPYRDSKGKWYLSSKIFSQHHCIRPVAVSEKPFSGSEEEAVLKLSNWYKNELVRLYQDTQTGDGLEIIQSQTSLNNDNSSDDAIQQVTEIELLDFDLKINTSIKDPIRFSFAPPIDNYNGSFSQVKGFVKYENDTLVGEVSIDVTSLEMGEESLNQSVFKQFVGDTFKMAKLSFSKSVKLVDVTEYSTLATFEFIGRKIEKEISFKLRQINTDTVYVDASFEVDITEFQTLEKPDGIEPLNSIVYINAQLLLINEEMSWLKQPLATSDDRTLSNANPTSYQPDANALGGDYLLDSGRVEFKTDKYNINAVTTDFSAALNLDGSFKAVVDLSTFTFKKGNLMKKHALGKEGMQVDLFPVASISGKIPIDFEDTNKQQLSSEVILDIHGVKEIVNLEFEVVYKEGKWHINTMVPVRRLIYNLTGKKASSIDEVVFVEVFVNMVSQ